MRFNYTSKNREKQETDFTLSLQIIDITAEIFNNKTAGAHRASRPLMNVIKNRPRDILCLVLPYSALFLLALMLYWKTVDFKFIPSWDDSEYVIDNIYIRGLTFENLKVIFGTTLLGNYAPLHLLSYSLDYSLWGPDPKGYHLTNALLHGLNAALAFALLKRITGKTDVAFIAASIFALHPLNVENVAWVSERKTLLAALFSFLSFISYLNFREDGGRGHYSLCVLFFILALASKPLTVTFPLVLAAYELCFRKEGRKWAYILPLFAMSAASAVTAVIAHMNYSAIEEGTLNLKTLFGAVYPTMLPIYWKYIWLIICPFNLSGYYDTTVYNSFLSLPVAVSLASWAVIFILVFWRGGDSVRFWFLWFWIWFLPVSNIIPIPVYYADRYMYVPAIGALVLGAQGAVYLASRYRKTGMAVLYCGFAALAVFYALLSYNRLDVWRNELLFWQDTAKKSPNQFKARMNLGYAYEMYGRYDEAEQEYIAAIRIYPSPDAISNLDMVRSKKTSGMIR